jgi:cytochrome oxidase Cu insertion factor (SCO1/SenC/PrrC family)
LRVLKQSGAALALMLAALIIPAGAVERPVRLIDQTGHAFTLPSLSGTPVIVTFVAAHCADACPLVNAQFARVARTFAAERRRVKLLTITLDPENDPPRVMSALARTFSADPHTWIVASGSVAEVHRAMRMFGVVAQRRHKSYPDVHTTFVYLVDSHGRLEKTLLASADLGTQVVAEVRAQWHGLAP